MPTIPSTVIVESCEESATSRVQTKQFGKGYKQISLDGINTKMRSISVVFGIQTQTEAIALIALLDPAAAVPVDWQSPLDTVVKKWIIPSYSVSMKQGKIFQIAAKLDLWNEP